MDFSAFSKHNRIFSADHTLLVVFLVLVVGVAVEDVGYIGGDMLLAVLLKSMSLVEDRHVKKLSTMNVLRNNSLCPSMIKFVILDEGLRVSSFLVFWCGLGM